MPTYKVVRKSDAMEVTRYTANATVLVSAYPLDQYDHLTLNDESQALEKVYGGRRILEPLEFLRLFTSDERKAIKQAAKTDQIADDFMYLLQFAESVHLDSPDTIAGTNYLEFVGKLAPGRAAEILNG